MTFMELFGWIMGGAALLYFLIALAKPDWFIALPAKVDESKRATKQRRSTAMAHNFPG